MKITLVTVCFKSAATLRTAMESVWRQRGVAVEYIVVDGGSTDGTVEILEAFEKRVAAADDSARAHFSFRWLSERDKGMYDAIIILGCVIRGETPHFDYICQGVTAGIARLNTTSECPIIYGLLTTENLQQAQDRSGGKLGNKGDECAIDAIKMAKF